MICGNQIKINERFLINICLGKDKERNNIKIVFLLINLVYDFGVCICKYYSFKCVVKVKVVKYILLFRVKLMLCVF